MGNLHVDIFDGSTWTQGVWSASGQQHTSNSDPWTLAEVDISDWAGLGHVGIRFRGSTVNSWQSDMAIDNIRLINLSASAVTSNTLGISSAHGSPSPSMGEHEFVSGSVITASVESVVVSGSTRYTCAGWSMLNHEPATGGGTTNIFTITNNASLTWNWDTNHYFTISSGTHGTVDQPNQWVAAGTPLVIEAFLIPTTTSTCGAAMSRAV